MGAERGRKEEFVKEKTIERERERGKGKEKPCSLGIHYSICLGYLVGWASINDKFLRTRVRQIIGNRLEKMESYWVTKRETTG
jgi:hypothetical protein